MTSIRTPAGYVPLHALAFGAADSLATPVDAAHPLPTTAVLASATAVALAGTTSVSAMAGPFVPQLGRPMWATLSGTWTGSVQLLRSTDGGATKLPLTYGDGSAKPAWMGAMQAPVAEETVATATYWLAITLVSGSVSYRLEQ